VGAALDRVLGTGDVTDLRVAVVGAGSMAALATGTVVARGAVDVVVLNRTAAHGDRLATEHAVRAAPLSDLAREISGADVVIACTGAADLMITAELLPEHPITLIDLAMPHDIDPAVAELPGVTLVNLRQLAAELDDSEAGRELAGVRKIVTEEVAAFLLARHQASVTPTVVALRSMATVVVDTEMERLATRLPDLDPAARDEVLQTLRRVADKLLHQPTVRVRELVNDAGAVSYAAALAELFALDPEAVDAVTRPERLP
jgi:glutamyl-tRNA reductase